MAENDRSSTARTLFGEISFWSSWVFGTLVSAVGLSSFLQHVLDIHLIPAYAHGLAVYRVVAHSFVGWLYWPFMWLAQYVSLTWFHWSLKITIPGWWKDLAVISTVCAAATSRERALLDKYSRETFGFGLKQTRIGNGIAASAIICLLGISLAGLFYLARIPRAFALRRAEGLGTGTIGFWAEYGDDDEIVPPEDEYSEDERNRMIAAVAQDERVRGDRYFLLSLVAAALACVFFFVTNAYPL